MVGRQVFELLRESAGPADISAYSGDGIADSKRKFFGVLSEEAGTSLQVLCLAKGAGLDGDSGSDCIAIAFVAVEAERDGLSDVLHLSLIHI